MRCKYCGQTIEGKISPEIRKKALELFADGFSLREISKKLEFKISYSSVARIVKDVVKESLNTEELSSQQE